MPKHIVIVGAGIIGANLALRLAQRGAAVTVIDAGMPGQAASGRSFGWINASFHLGPAHFALRHEAIAAYHRLQADIGATGVNWCGALCWDQSPEALEAQAKSLSTLGYNVGRLSRAEFAALEPAIAAPPDLVLRFPDEGVVDAGALTQRLLSAACDHGAKFWQGCTVTGFATASGRITGVETAQGTLNADHTILAAGCATQGLAANAGIALPMLPRPGLILRTRPLPPILRRVLVTPQMEVKQDDKGHIIAPTAAGHQGDDTDRITDLPGQIADRALAALQSLLPDRRLEWDSIALAHRPVPQDGLPAIGPSGIDGLTIAVLHSGVTLAPLVAEIVAHEVMGGDSDPLLAGFRPARFA